MLSIKILDQELKEKFSNIPGLLKNALLSFWCIILIILIALPLQAQNLDSTSQQQGRLKMAADFLIHNSSNTSDFDTLIGNVRITQDSMFLFCNKAFVRDKSFVEAIGEVVIIQNDSIQLFADSLIYNDLVGIANLYGEVIVRNGQKQLFTHEAEYDVNKKSAYYEDGATLFNGKTKLISEEGIYNIEEAMAFFRDKITIIDSSTVLRTDTLNYDLEKDIIHIVAPTNMSTDSSDIYFERGF